MICYIFPLRQTTCDYPEAWFHAGVHKHQQLSTPAKRHTKILFYSDIPPFRRQKAHAQHTNISVTAIIFITTHLPEILMRTDNHTSPPACKHY